MRKERIIPTLKEKSSKDSSKHGVLIVIVILFTFGCDFTFDKERHCDGDLKAIKSGNLFGKWGFVDVSGNIVIPYIYSNALCFSESLAAVKKKGKWGFIDSKGNVVAPFIYDEVVSFSDGMAAVRIGNKDFGKWGFLNKEGFEVVPHKIVPFKYNAVFSFSDGLARVKKNNKWGFIDKNGTEVVTCKYDTINVFKEGLALISSNGKWGFIDKNCKEVVPCNYYDYALEFSEGLAAVRIGDDENGRWGYINKLGNVVIFYNYHRAQSFSSDGLARVSRKVTLVEEGRNGAGVIGQEYEMGLIDKYGNQIVPLKYSNIGDFNGDLAVVSLRVYQRERNQSGYIARTKRGVVNRRGQEIIEPNFDNIFIRENEIEARTGTGSNVSSQFFDHSGNRVNQGRQNQRTNTQSESSTHAESTTSATSSLFERLNTAVDTVANSSLIVDTNSESTSNTWNCGVSTRNNPGGVASVKAELNNGTLIISGTGAMADFSSTGAPWHNVRSSIKKVLIYYGVTSIGNFAFSDCAELRSITLPEGITSVGLYSFNNCIGLTEIINYAITPLNISTTVYSGVNIPAITMYVPAESIEVYRRVSANSGGYIVRAIGSAGSNNTIIDTNPGIQTTPYFTSSATSATSENRRTNATASSTSSIPGRFPQASQRLLAVSDVQNLSKDELRIMRNEIFARHGLIFQTSEMRTYFQNQNWYTPKHNDVNNMLTNIETRNIQLIQRYE